MFRWITRIVAITLASKFLNKYIGTRGSRAASGKQGYQLPARYRIVRLMEKGLHSFSLLQRHTSQDNSALFCIQSITLGRQRFDFAPVASTAGTIENRFPG